MNTVNVNCITTQTTAPAQISISFVTLAFGWGYEDGQNGNLRQPWAYWTLSDPRYAEYSEGYDAGQAAAQARQ